MHQVFHAIELAVISTLLLIAAWYAYTFPPIFFFYETAEEAIGENMPGLFILALYYLVPLVVLLLAYSAVLLVRGISRRSTAMHFAFWTVIAGTVALAFALDFVICHPVRLSVENVIPMSEAEQMLIYDQHFMYDEIEWVSLRSCTEPVKVFEKFR